MDGFDCVPKGDTLIPWEDVVRIPFPETVSIIELEVMAVPVFLELSLDTFGLVADPSCVNAMPAESILARFVAEVAMAIDPLVSVYIPVDKSFPNAKEGKAEVPFSFNSKPSGVISQTSTLFTLAPIFAPFPNNPLPGYRRLDGKGADALPEIKGLKEIPPEPSKNFCDIYVMNFARPSIDLQHSSKVI